MKQSEVKSDSCLLLEWDDWYNYEFITFRKYEQFSVNAMQSLRFLTIKNNDKKILQIIFRSQENELLIDLCRDSGSDLRSSLIFYSASSNNNSKILASLINYLNNVQYPFFKKICGIGYPHNTKLYDKEINSISLEVLTAYEEYLSSLRLDQINIPEFVLEDMDEKSSKQEKGKGDEIKKDDNKNQVKGEIDDSVSLLDEDKLKTPLQLYKEYKISFFGEYYEYQIQKLTVRGGIRSGLNCYLRKNPDAKLDKRMLNILDKFNLELNEHNKIEHDNWELIDTIPELKDIYEKLSNIGDMEDDAEIYDLNKTIEEAKSVNYEKQNEIDNCDTISVDDNLIAHSSDFSIIKSINFYAKKLMFGSYNIKYITKYDEFMGFLEEPDVLEGYIKNILENNNPISKCLTSSIFINTEMFVSIIGNDSINYDSLDYTDN